MSGYIEAADALKTIIDTEWSTEGWTAIHDNLHPAIGQGGVRIGISLDEEAARAGNMYQNDISIVVKFYTRWDPDVDYDKKVDPRIIAAHGERFRQAIKAYNAPGTHTMWYFNLLRIRYPNDPVGNKTRFEADLVAYGSNTALVETVG